MLKGQKMLNKAIKNLITSFLLFTSLLSNYALANNVTTSQIQGFAPSEQGIESSKYKAIIHKNKKYKLAEPIAATGFFVDMAAGIGNGYAIDNTGAVWSIGRNAEGQLARGDTTEYNNWSANGWWKTSLSNAKDVKVGYYNAYALDNNGDVWVVGRNVEGQLGLNTNTNINTWTKTTLSNIKEIAAGYYHAYALDNNGNIWSTGKNNYGQLGLNDVTNRKDWVKTNLTNIKSIAAGDSHGYALDNSGNVWSVGYNGLSNGYGQLGLGDTANRLIWTKTTLSNIKEIKSGCFHGYALDNSNEAWSVGYNGFGQLGFGDTSNRQNWTKTTLTNVKTLEAGCYVGYYLNNDGSQWSVGRNNYGQLGLGNTTQQNNWTKTTLTNASKIKSGSLHTYILNSDGEMHSVGYNLNGQLGVLTSTLYESNWLKVTIPE